MTLQTLTLGMQKFVLLTQKYFDRLVAQAQQQTADDYWTASALAAEARAKARNEAPIPFSEIEKELDARRCRIKRKK